MRGRRAIARLLGSRYGNRFAFFAFAALIGALVGAATLGLIQLIELVQRIGYGDASEARYASIVAEQPVWRVLLVPTLGGLFVGLLLERLPGKRYHGIADVMEACALNSARMPVRSGVAAALAAGVSLGAGAPLGREGPAVHIGASIAAWIAERLRLDHRQSLALLGCGAAAAVAVSFGAPVAAVIFALEVIVGYYTLRAFAPIVIATVAAVAVRQAFLGAAPTFDIPAAGLTSAWELGACALIGIAGALVVKLLIGATARVDAAWERVRAPRWLRPAGAGLLIGMLAVELPLVTSIGFEATFAALRGELAPGMLAVLFAAKLAAVALALGSGFAGGVFGPAIYLGAMLGGVCWYLVAALAAVLGTHLPFELAAHVSTQGVWAVVGMAAVASAMLGAPISTILIVFELTHDYAVTLGVMTAAAFASTTMSLGEHGSFFRWQLAQRGVDIRAGRDLSLLTGERCRSVLSARYATATASTTVGELSARMGAERLRVAFFVDDAGTFFGSANLPALISHGIEHGMSATAWGSVERSGLDAEYVIGESTNIVVALQRMAERQLEYVPVIDVDDAGTPRPVGVVFRSDLLEAHYDVVRRAREHEFGIS